jgi:hypothetical protein
MSVLRDQPALTFPTDLLRASVLGAPHRCTVQDSWHGHIPFAFWCVESLAPRVLVELGCHRGDSYCAFCQAVDEQSLDTRCFGVDTWRGDAQAGQYGEEVYEELKLYHDPRYGRFSKLIRSTFDEALAEFPDQGVDLLHIDGAHSYEAVRHDFATWLPKVSRRGVVLFHDIAVRDEGFGVWRLWEELRGAYPSFTFLHSHGLGVLAVGPSPPEALRRLTSLDPREAEDVRLLFRRLGDAVALEDERRKRGAVESALQDVTDRFGRLVALQDAERNGFLAERKDHLAEKNTLLAERRALLGSTSWKVTAPLRFAGGLLKRLRGGGGDGGDPAA